MQSLAEQVADQRSEAERLFTAFKAASSYQRVIRKDEDIVVYTIAIKVILKNVDARVSDGQYADAHDMLGDLLDSLYEKCKELPLPFLSA